MIYHRTAMFGCLENGVTRPAGGDRCNQSQKPTKLGKPVKCERHHRADRGNHRRRTHPLTPLRVDEEQRFGVRHPPEDLIRLVAAGVDRKLCRPSSQDQDKRQQIADRAPRRVNIVRIERKVPRKIKTIGKCTIAGWSGSGISNITYPFACREFQGSWEVSKAGCCLPVPPKFSLFFRGNRVILRFPQTNAGS